MTDQRWSYVGEQVRYRRERKFGWTQQELVDHVNELAGKQAISIATLQIIENARQSSYRPATLLWLSRGLDWPDDAVEQLLAGEPAANLRRQTIELPLIGGAQDYNSTISQLSPEAQAEVDAIIAREIGKQR